MWSVAQGKPMELSEKQKQQLNELQAQPEGSVHLPENTSIADSASHHGTVTIGAAGNNEVSELPPPPLVSSQAPRSSTKSDNSSVAPSSQNLSSTITSSGKRKSQVINKRVKIRLDVETELPVFDKCLQQLETFHKFRLEVCEIKTNKKI